MKLPELKLRTITSAFERALAAKPNSIAHVDRSGSWTYSEAFERCLRTAGGLAELGVAPGDAVAVLLDNSFDAVHALFGLGLTDRIQVPINTAYKREFLSHVIKDSQARVLLIEDKYCDRLSVIEADVPLLTTVIVRGGDGSMLSRDRFRVVLFEQLLDSEPATMQPARPSDIQAYFYTSGTTGTSKGVIVTHAQAYTYASREDDPRSGLHERTLVVAPMFHFAGQLYGVYQSLISIGTCVLEPVFSVSSFWSCVREHRVNNVLVLGAMAQLLYQQEPRSDDADNSLELVYMGPLVSDVEGFKKRFGVEVGSVYGQTECGAPIMGLPETIVGGECGYPREGFECRIVDETGVDVAPGTIGELIVRPALPWTISIGYLNQPEATLINRRNLWLHTGDAFRMDDTGRFFLVDRIKDALRRRGENISSFEVERVINQYPPVLESAVIAVPSSLTEDDVKAVIVVRDLLPRMPYFMVPRYVELVKEMPRTPTQKIQKVKLREAGVTANTWDREAAGVVVRRES